MGYDKPDTSFWKAGIVVLLIATLIASAAAVSIQQQSQSNYNLAAQYQEGYQNAQVHLNLESQSLSSVESSASEQATNILLSGVPVSLTNSTNLVLAYNGTLAGYILLNGITASRSWVVACYGVSTLAACDSQVAAGTGYIRLVYYNGVEVPAVPGPMVISMSSDAPGEFAITATLYT